MPQAALRRCSGAPISAYLADSVPAIVSAMVGAIRGGTGASPRLGRTRDTVSWRGDPDLSASTEGRVLRVVPGGNESGEGPRTEVQRAASTVRCAMLYRVDREGELRSSGGSRTSQKRQSNTTGKLDSHRVARRRGRRTHSTAPHHWRGSRYRTSRPASYAVREQTSRLNCIHRAAQLHSQGAVREQTSRSRRSTAPDASLTLRRSCR